MISHYGVFRKDSKVLFEHAASALIIQILIIIIASVSIRYDSFSIIANLFSLRSIEAREWLPKLQLTITVIIALICAGYYHAEEKAGNNHKFLSRLPVSHSRIFIEKFTAGFLTISIVIALQLSAYLLCEFCGLLTWENHNQLLIYLILFPLCAYLIGIAISLHVQQTIGVILGGSAIVFGMIIIYPVPDIILKEFSVIHALPVLAIVLLSLSFFVYHLQHSSQPIRGLILEPSFLKKTQKTQNTIAFYSLLFLLFFILSLLFVTEKPGSKFYTFFVYAFAALCLILGITSYNPVEKKGLHCVLFYHPISLRTIYWEKLLYTLFLGSIPAFGFSIAYILVTGMNLASPLIFEFLAQFTGALLGCVVGMVCTQLIHSQVYAFIEAIPLAFFLIIFNIAYHSEFITGSYFFEFYRNNQNYPSVGVFYTFSILYNEILLIAGLSLIGLAITTDRSVLTGTVLYRHFCIGRLLVLLLCVIYIFIHLGFFDLFYLMTGFDIGIG